MPVKMVEFKKHMREKAETWKPYSMDLGEDFCVFEFDTERQRDDANVNLAFYASYYGYISDIGPNESLVIIDTKERG